MCVHVPVCIMPTLGCSGFKDIQLWSGYPDTPAGEGGLQLCNDFGQWRAMCHRNFNCQEAKVACRALGYNGTVRKYDKQNAYTETTFSNPFRYSNLQKRG